MIIYGHKCHFKMHRFILEKVRLESFVYDFDRC